MKIAVVGATGSLGGAIAREALRRGHQVTAIARDVSGAPDGAQGVVADVNDSGALVDALRGHDAVVSAVTDRTTADRSIIPTTARSLLAALTKAGGARLAVVGGGGSLQVTPGVRAVDEPGFPAQYRAEALAQADALAILRADRSEVDWTYLSPPPHHLVPGDRTGTYRVQGGDLAFADTGADSTIAVGDFASALVDELEAPRFSRQRFTVAY
jgi:putative NADH-flavin reductase